MANIGDVLKNPETGWKRIDDRNLNIKYIGNWKPQDPATGDYYFLKTGMRGEPLNNNGETYCEFYCYSTKIRIIGCLHNICSDKIFIQIDDEEYFYNQNHPTGGIYHILLFEKNDLDKKVHKIKIFTKDVKFMNMDCFDIDSDGYMLYHDETTDKLYYDVTPIMTSNTTPAPYVVSASSEYSSTMGAYRVFDGSLEQDYAYQTSSGNMDCWIKLNFGNKTSVSSISLSRRKYTDSDTFPKSFSIHGSDDGISETLIATFENQTNWESGETRIFNFGKLVSYNYYKLKIINNNGNANYTVIGELRYLLDSETPFYLIQDNADSKVYNYDEENNTLVEVTDTSILNKNALENTCIYDLSKVIPLFDILSDDLTILCNKDTKIVANGIKTTKELIIGKNSFPTKVAKNIDYFKLDENATAKVIFSIDDGITWKTYNPDTQSFEDLSISIPVGKDYSDFTEEEKTAWNEAKEIVYNQGIDSSILNTIDFNKLNAEKIRFGYVLSATDAKTMDKMTNLIWQFDSKGVMELVSTNDVKQQLYYGGVKLISNIDADMLKVNITYEGISGEGSATSLDIDRTTEEIQGDINNIF